MNILSIWGLSCLMLITCQYTFARYEAKGTNNCQSYVTENCTWHGPTSLRINSNDSCNFHCIYDSTNKKAIRLDIHILSSIKNVHTFTTVKRNKRITSWNLPVVSPAYGESQIFNSLEEILCPPIEEKQDQLFFAIDTSSENNVTMNISLTPISFLIQTNEMVKIKSTPVSPWYKFYEWEEGSDSVTVRAESIVKDGGNVCAFLSLQQGYCPIGYTKEGIIGSEGKYISFTKRGSLIAHKSRFPDGVAIVVLPLFDDLSCSGNNYVPKNHTSRWKTTEIEIFRHLTVYDKIWFYIIMLIAKVLFTIAITSGLIKKMKRDYLRELILERRKEINPVHSDEARNSSTLASSTSSAENDNVAGNLQLSLEHRPSIRTDEMIDDMNKETALLSTSVASSLITVENITVDEVPNVPETDQQLTSEMKMPELTANFNPRFLHWWKQRGDLENTCPEYQPIHVGFHCVFIVAALYISLPFFGILKDYLTVFIKEGFEDKCYFNSRCIHSLWFFTDFTAVFSNLFYLLLGFSFLIIIRYHPAHEVKKDLGYECGVNFNYGLYKSLGVSLIIEGCLSALYHVCPNSVTLRFDMMFMYVILIIVIVSVWALRHGSVITHLYSTMSVVGIFLIVAEMHGWVSRILFWIVIVILHSVACVTTSYTLYNYGTWSFSPRTIFSIHKELKPVFIKCSEILRTQSSQELHCEEQKLIQTQESEGGKILRLIAGILINGVMIVAGPAIDMKAYSYIFYTCIANMVVHFLNYLITKVLHREKGPIYSWVALAISFLLWIPALVFFKMANTDCETSAACSRTLNSECILFGVLDSHDLWHTLSAIALYASFIGIVTIDNDVIVRKSEKLRTF